MDRLTSSPDAESILQEGSAGRPHIRPGIQARVKFERSDLHFDLTEVLIGASSLVIRYLGPRGPSAEVFWFDARNKVYRAAAHYEG